MPNIALDYIKSKKKSEKCLLKLRKEMEVQIWKFFLGNIKIFKDLFKEILS